MGNILWSYGLYLWPLFWYYVKLLLIKLKLIENGKFNNLIKTLIVTTQHKSNHKKLGLHTNGTIKENFESINEISGSSMGPEKRLKDFVDIRAFNSAKTIWRDNGGI